MFQCKTGQHICTYEFIYVILHAYSIQIMNSKHFSNFKKVLLHCFSNLILKSLSTNSNWNFLFMVDKASIVYLKRKCLNNFWNENKHTLLLHPIQWHTSHASNLKQSVNLHREFAMKEKRSYRKYIFALVIIEKQLHFLNLYI